MQWFIQHIDIRNQVFHIWQINLTLLNREEKRNRILWLLNIKVLKIMISMYGKLLNNEVKQIQIVTRAFYCTAGWMKIGNMNSDGNLHLLLLWSKASLDCHQGFLLHNWLNKIGNNRTSYSPVGAGTGAELGNMN